MLIVSTQILYSMFPSHTLRLRRLVGVYTVRSHCQLIVQAPRTTALIAQPVKQKELIVIDNEIDAEVLKAMYALGYYEEFWRKV